MYRRLELFALASVVLLTGCARKFTSERFEMIRAGADMREDVRELLGDPRFDAGDQWYYEDLDRHCSALIYFGDDGRVNGKEWLDGATGRWEGHNPNAKSGTASDARYRGTRTTTVGGD